MTNYTDNPADFYPYASESYEYVSQPSHDDAPDHVRTTDDDGRNYCGDLWCDGHTSATDQCVPEPIDMDEHLADAHYDESNRYWPALLAEDRPCA